MKPKGRTKREMVHGRVPVDYARTLGQMAKSRGVSLTTLVSAAVVDYVRRVLAREIELPAGVPSLARKIVDRRS